jgi:hypothetical protein
MIKLEAEKEIEKSSMNYTENHIGRQLTDKM